MTTRRILAALGILLMAAGALMVFRPRPYWTFWEDLLIGEPGGRPTVSVFIIGGLSIILGVFLLYIGLRRLTLFSTLMRIAGILTLAVGLLMVLAQEAYRDLLNTIFYGRSDWAKMTMSYVGGPIRFFIGVLFLIAGLKRLPDRPEARAAARPSGPAASPPAVED